MKKNNITEKNKQNKIAMLGISFVLSVLVVSMLVKSEGRRNEIAAYEARLGELDLQIEEEKDRTQEIEDIKEYMETDEYVEEVAREKLGLVKENEVVFQKEEN